MGNRKMLTFIVLILFIFNILNTINFDNSYSILFQRNSDNERKWTVITYLSDDNNLEKYAINILNQMESGKKLNNEISVIVMVDQNGYYNESPVDWSNTRLYEITKDSSDTIKSKLLVDYDEMNMGSFETLSLLLNYSFINYPAEHYLFIGHNHGGGIKGWSYDYNDTSSTKDRLTMWEFRKAFEISESLVGRKVDIISLFACNMAYLEVAYELHNVADYLIAQQMTGWGACINYKSIIKKLERNPDIAPRKLCEKICRIFRRTGINTKYKTTISICDLQKIYEFTKKFSEFSNILMDLISTNYMKTLVNSIANSYQYSYVGRDVKSIIEFIVHDKELYLFNSTFNDLGQHLIVLFDEMIVYNRPHRTLLGKSNGLNIYVPFPYASFWVDYTDYNNTNEINGIDLLFTNKTSWNIFLNKFYFEDSDHDELFDWYEYFYEMDVSSSDCNFDGQIDALQDFENDSLTCLDEQNYGSNPWLIDTDNDGLLDNNETEDYQTKPFLIDTDFDTVPDGIEIERGTFPRKPESQSCDYYICLNFKRIWFPLIGVSFITLIVSFIIVFLNKRKKKERMKD